MSFLKSQLQIMSIGMPGTGKSTLLKCLELLLPDAKRINQDECKGSAKTFNMKANIFSRSHDCKVLLLDKCFHNKRIRNNSCRCIKLQNLTYLVFYHPKDLLNCDKSTEQKIQFMKYDNAMNLAKERIYQRGAGHLNLYPSHNLDEILGKFVKSTKPLSPSELQKSVAAVYIDMTLDKKTVIKYVLNVISEMCLPNLNVTNISDNAIENAILTVYNQEISLSKYNIEKTNFYWAVEIENLEVIKDNSVIANLLNDNKKLILKDRLLVKIVQPEIHLMKMNSQKSKILVTHIIFDDSTVILKIFSELEYLKNSKYLAITVQKYRLSENSKEIQLETPLELEVKVIKILKSHTF
jgi:energy-coupling factor transporter ATP-binding protein EcfA2